MKLDDNVVVKLNGNEITNWVIAYNRSQQICTGIGTLEMQVPESSGINFDPWDIIEIYEYGDKVGKFYVSESKESARTGIIAVGADDGSKLITDYFLTETYQSDVLTYSRYWIEKILDEATVDYEFSVGDDQGGPVNPNTSFGLDSAYNLVQGLLQQSGWYLYFNPNGKAIIGRIDKSLNDVDHSIDDGDILNFGRERDDSRLRNRAVVWGNANPLIGESEKAKILAELFKGKLSAAGYNFLQLLTSKKRSSLLPDAIEQFRLLLHQHRHILKGELVSVVELSDTQVGKIKDSVEKMTGKTVIFDKRLDPSIIGGFIVKVEDIIIDNSIRFQLNKLRERLIVQ